MLKEVRSIRAELRKEKGHDQNTLYKKIKNCKSLNTALNYESLILKIIKATRTSVTLLKDISYKITRLLLSLMTLQKKIENISKVNCMKVEKFQNHQALITF